MKEEFKTVARFNDAFGARLAAGMLNENGIPAAVFGADSTALLNAVGTVEVKVNAADYDAAISLLKTSRKPAGEDPSGSAVI